MLGANAQQDILQWERDNYTKSISCVAMMVLLAAESLGLGACYMTGPLIAQNQIMEIAKTKPGREIGALIPIGYKIVNPCHGVDL
jgi:nitroreductase